MTNATGMSVQAAAAMAFFAVATSFAQNMRLKMSGPAVYVVP